MRTKFEKEVEEWLLKQFGKRNTLLPTMLQSELRAVERCDSLLFPYLEPYLESHNFRGLTVLDCGCGTGGKTVAFQLRGAKIIGVDISDETLKLAMLRSKVYRTSPYFCKADLLRMPFVDEIFDLCLFIDVIEHMPYSITKRQLQKSGESLSREDYSLSALLIVSIFEISTSTIWLLFIGFQGQLLKCT